MFVKYIRNVILLIFDRTEEFDDNWSISDTKEVYWIHLYYSIKNKNKIA